MADDRYRLPPFSLLLLLPWAVWPLPAALWSGAQQWGLPDLDRVVYGELAESLPGNPTAHGKRRRVMTRLIFREVVLGAIYFLLVTAIMAELIHFAI